MGVWVATGLRHHAGMASIPGTYPNSVGIAQVGLGNIELDAFVEELVV